MLSEKDLRELIDYFPSTPVVSVYLNTEPAEGNADAYRLRLRTMLKNVDLPQDVDAIERYFEHEYDWSGRGVAIFSNASEKFFRVYPLAVPVQNLVHVGYKPSIRPLTDLLDSIDGDMGSFWWINRERDCLTFIWANCANRKDILAKPFEKSNGGALLPFRGEEVDKPDKTRMLQKRLSAI